MRIAHWVALLALTGAAGTLAIRRREHRPIALFFGALMACEALRAAGLPLQLARVLYFVPPALWALVLARVLRAPEMVVLAVPALLVPVGASLGGASRGDLHGMATLVLGFSVLGGIAALWRRLSWDSGPAFEVLLVALLIGSDGLALVWGFLPLPGALDRGWLDVSLVCTLVYALCLVSYALRYWWHRSPPSRSS